MNSTQGVDSTVMLVNSIDPILTRAKDVRKSIEEFLLKVDHEQATLSWPTVLDNFALLSGQVTSMLAMVRSDKTPMLRNYPIVPLKLNPDQDPLLMELTARRVSIMSHAEVPDYLRTKPDPEVEQAERQLVAEVTAHADQSSISPAQLTQFNKQCNKVLEKVKSLRANWRANLVGSGTAASATNYRSQLTPEVVSYIYYGCGQIKQRAMNPNVSVDQKPIISDIMSMQ